MAGSRWYYLIEGLRRGPVSSLVLRTLVSQQILKSDDLVWKPGLKEWVPARKIKGLIPEEIDSGKLRGEFRRNVAEGGGSGFASSEVSQNLSQLVRMERALPGVVRDGDEEEEENFRATVRRKGFKESGGAFRRGPGETPRVIGSEAGVWMRLIPCLVDGLAMIAWGMPILLASLVFLKVESIAEVMEWSVTGWGQGEISMSGVVLLLISTVPGVVMFSVLTEGSQLQGTLGKNLLGLKIVDVRGERIGPVAAIVRNLVKFVPWLVPVLLFQEMLWGTLGLMVVSCAWLMAGLMPGKQALHDMVAGTYVVRGPFRYPDEEGRLYLPK